VKHKMRVLQFSLVYSLACEIRAQAMFWLGDHGPPSFFKNSTSPYIFA